MGSSEAKAVLPESLELLARGALELGLDLGPPLLERFGIYLAELRRWNARVNLTGLKTEREMVIRHFLDGLAVLPFLGEAREVADIGSGAGFPGLVFKLVRPEISLTLVESRGKKAAFLEYLITLLHLEGVEVAPVYITPRLARDWGPRFEVVVSRAALKLKDFLAVAAPILKPGGRALALTGPHLPEGEWQRAAAAAPALGFDPLERLPYRLPVAGEVRLAVRARKRGSREG